MFIDPICKINLRQAHRLSGLVGASAVILVMLAASSLFGGTAEELELAKGRDAQAASESLSFINVAEELDLAPAPIPSADCPPRSTGRSRPSTPTRVSPMTTYRPPPVYVYKNPRIVRHDPPRSAGKIYKVSQDLKPTYAASPPAYPPVSTVQASQSSEPTTRAVTVVYKTERPLLTPEEKESLEKARSEIKEINRELEIKENEIGRKESALENCRSNIEITKPQLEETRLKMAYLAEEIAGATSTPVMSHPKIGDYLKARKIYEETKEELNHWNKMERRLNWELESLREERGRMRDAVGVRNREIRRLLHHPPELIQGR
jgi:hypothetical protein